MIRYIVGIDIGGTTVKCGLFSEEGKLQEKWKIITDTKENGSYILQNIADSISEKLMERDIKKCDIIGIGVGVPGPVQDSSIVKKCVNLGWDVKNVAQELETITGIKTKVGNDANIAALGELVQGSGQGCKNLVMITLGTGVGGGIIVNRQIVEGIDGAGGEIGHINVNEDETEACGCGNKGCLEQYASATGLVRMAKQALKNEHVETLLNEEELTAEKIFANAKEKDSFALELVDSYCKLLGKVMAQIACIMNPDIFVIGGGVSEAGEILLSAILKYYQSYAFHASRNTKIMKAVLGNDAGIYGGMGLFLYQT